MGSEVGDFIGDITGSSRQAEAGGAAALAQQTEARRQFDLARADRERALALADSPQEIAALERSLQVQEKSLARQEKLAASIDPAILEAGQQALSLLRGEEARALQPLRRGRQRQRQQLLNTLREQLGPGAETSSAGIQALQNFDFQTSQGLAGAQQQQLGQLFGFGAQTDNRLAQQAAGFRGIAGGFGQIAGRRAGAFTGGTQFVQQAGQGLVGTAGAEFVEEQLRGAGQMKFFETAVGFAGAAVGGGSGGGRTRERRDTFNVA